jgi:hypothetical protein
MAELHFNRPGIRAPEREARAETQREASQQAGQQAGQQMGKEALKPARTGEPDSLDRPLPPDVVFRSASWYSSYRNYPAFSSPWFWRRSAFFVPGAAAVGFIQSLPAWRLVDAETSFVISAFNILVWILIVIAGPGLATLVRHEHMQPQRERVGVVVAVVAGMAICFAAQYAGNRLSRDYLMPRAVAAGTVPKSVAEQPSPDAGIIALYIGWQALVFFVLSGGLGLHAYFKELNEQDRWKERQRERDIESLRAQKVEADMQLTVLQAQVEPHFLFNTLASVHSLIGKDPRRAEATIEALVDHLRATLPKLRKGVGLTQTTLAEQIEVCSSYLAVMKVRMADRLKYQINVPAALGSHPFPPLMLISLVENAIKHGIEPSAGGGTVSIIATELWDGQERRLAVSVSDDGVGLRPGLGDGVGLANLRAQLTAQFGSRGRFSIAGRTGGGTVATLILPFAEATA